MSKKIALLLSAILGAAGIILVVVGGILGVATGEGSGLISRSVDNMSFRIGSLHIGIGGFGFWDDSENTSESLAGGKQYTDVSAISLDLDGMSVMMQSAPGDAVTITADAEIENYLRADWDGYELHIEKKDGYQSWGKFGKINITVPENQTFDEIEISMDAGNLTADSFKTEYLDLTMDGGAFTGTGKIIAGDVEGSADAGSVTFENLDTEYLDLSCDSGSFSAGLAGARRDYNLYLMSDLGSIRCGDSEMNDLENSLNETHDEAEREITVNADMGSIEISFQK